MKILYLLPSFNLYGGGARKTLDLANLSRHEIYVYVWSKGCVPKEYESFRREFAGAARRAYEGFHGRNIPKHVRDLLKIVDHERIEVIHAYFSFGETLGWILKKLRARLRVVVSFESSLDPGITKRLLLKHFYRRIDFFIYISEYVRREKTRIYPVLREKAGRIIYNGAGKRAATGSFLHRAEGNVISSVSGLNSGKNISTLIRAVSELVHNRGHSDVTLLVAGDGPQRSELQREIDDFALARNVRLLGYYADVGSIFDKSRLYLHSCSLEGFGIAVAEAMHHGLPVIVARAGALPELVTDGESGLIVDPFDVGAWADAIERLLADDQLCRALGRAAQQRAQEMFNLEAFVQQHDDLYDSLPS